MAFVDWAENGEISSKPPATYWPVMAARVDSERLKNQRYWHALPLGWEQLGYDEFLDKRRRLIAEVVRDGFQRLVPASSGDHQDTSVTVDALMAAGESVNVEFKSSARWNFKGKVKDSRLEHVIVKTVAAFANNEGGTLLIGVSDSGEVLGLDEDYQTLSKPNRDGYELCLSELFKTCLSGTASTLVRVSFASIGGRDVCRVDVAASARPVFARPPEGRNTASSGSAWETVAGRSWARTWFSTKRTTGPEPRA
jgi:Holliday junction resolvase